MTPNDLYSECAPVHRKRTPAESMFFPLRPQRPDRFLAAPTATQLRRGNSHMVITNKVKAMLRGLGL